MEYHDDYIEDSIDVGTLVRRLRDGWLAIVLCVGGALAAAAIFLHFATYRYAAAMRVSPVQGASDGISSKLGQLGGLAAAAGVALPDSGGGSGFKLYVESLQSREVAIRLATDRVLMQQAFEREWDPRVRRWRRPASGLRSIASPMKAILGVPEYAWEPPNAARLQEFLKENIIIDQSPKTPVVTVSLLDKNPLFATHLLTKLDKTIDGMLRERALLRTNDYIAYLNGKLQTVTMQEQRNAIVTALGEQERFKMAASSTRPFAAEMFDAPSVSDRPVSPAPYRILAVGLLLGLASGVGLALMRRDRSDSRRDAVPLT